MTAHAALAIAVAAASAVVSFGLTAWVLGRLPTDYLINDTPREVRLGRPRWLQVVLAAGQNTLALFLILAGIVMSVPGVPGQGLLTILVGLIVMRFPGKEKLERRILAKPSILHGINRFRRWVHAPPLTPPP